MEPLNQSLPDLAISSEILCFCVKNTHPFIGLSRKTALGRPLLRREPLCIQLLRSSLRAARRQRLSSSKNSGRIGSTHVQTVR